MKYILVSYFQDVKSKNKKNRKKKKAGNIKFELVILLSNIVTYRMKWINDIKINLALQNNLFVVG